MYKLLLFATLSCVVIVTNAASSGYLRPEILKEMPYNYGLTERYISNKFDPNRSNRQIHVDPVPEPTQPPAVIQNCLRTCPVTSEFNPICGVDGVQYSNPGSLTCTMHCTGRKIGIKHYGSCSGVVRS